MEVTPEILDRHKKLLTDIADHMEVGSEEYEQFIEFMKTFLPRGILSQKKTLLGKFELLTTRGYLKPGDYQNLLKIAEQSKNIDIAGLIRQAEKEIRELKARIQRQGTGQVNRSTGNGHLKRAASESEEPSSSTKHPRLDNGNETKEEADRLSVEVSDQSYYDFDGKQGVLLILNSRDNRQGTDEDVKNLKNFFQNELNFEVHEPRSDTEHDFTTGQVQEFFQQIKNHLNNNLVGKKIYCFVCVILAHGKEGVVKTKDGEIKVEDIRHQFNNDNLPNFTGKPKVFIIQACQGYGTQASTEVDDADLDIETEIKDDTEIKDESDKIIKVPTDADTLLAFATTPGNQAFRRTYGPKVGSWFITVLVDVFRKYHTRHHLEDMLITVRERVAHEWTKSDGGKQMPCVWSSLTRRVMLMKR